MSIFKRGKTFWTDFTQDGTRYGESLRTTNWQEALRREKERIAEVASGHSIASHRQFAKWPFEKAADHYLESRKLDLAERSLAKERELLSNSKKHFGAIPIVRLTPEMLREYLAKRKGEGLSNATLNMLAGAVLWVLKMAKRRHLFTDEIKRLPETANIGRALTAVEQVRLLQVAATNPEWDTLGAALVLALSTTARSAELKHLRWGGVDFLDRTITIRHSKTIAGHRRVPLNEDAFMALLGLRKRADLLGEVNDDHYVFAACESGHFDPTRPQKTWRTAWRSLRRTAAQGDGEKGIPAMPQLATLRFHDLRHTAITALAEGQNSDQTVMALAGHVSRQMLEHYSHIRREPKRLAVESLSLSKLLPAEAQEAGTGVLTAQSTAQKLLPPESEVSN